MPQDAVPNNDDSIGSYTDESAGTTDIFQSIDEGIPHDDVDFIRSEDNPSSSVYICGLSSVTDPLSSIDHDWSFRRRANESGGGSPPTVDLVAELRQGTTVIRTITQLDISQTWTTFAFTLTGTEANSITDYSDLNVRFTFDKSAGARTAWGEISFVNLRVPDVTSPRRIFIT